jgi:hypothetical protein
MSSLSGQSAGTKSLSGLSDTYSTNIVANTVEVLDEFIVDTGATITLPANSIQDSYLSTNVALLNRNPQTFTGVNTFNNNVNIQYPALLNILDTSLTRGLQIQNDNTNPALTLFRGIGNSSRFNFLSNNALGVPTTNFYIFNGDSCYLQGANGLGIGMVGSAISLDGICSFTNTTTPVITQSIALADNSTKIATTAFVKGQGYATLAGTQTFTGINTFNALTVHNATLKNFQSTQAIFPGDFRMLDSTQTYLTQMYQTGTTCVIDAPFASSIIRFSTRDAANSGLINLLMENKNHVVLQGSASEIDILGTAVSLNGVCSFTNTTTPVITQSIALADNSTKIATTAFVKGQGYALTTDLANYGLLAGANTWTGTTNTFSNASLGNQISIQSTANSGPSTISQITNSLVISAVTNNTGAFQSTLTLSSRTPTNTGCVLFNGNSTNIVIGQNSTNTNISSTNLNMSSVCSFTNTTTPTITQAIALSDNSTNIATTAFVKGQAYAELTPTANPQIFTGNQKFQNSGANLPISIGNTTAGATYSGGMFIGNNPGSYNASVAVNDLVLLSTGSGNGTGTLTLTSWSNTPVGLKISPTSSTFIGSVNVPTQLTTDNSTLVASTAYVKNQGYLVASDLTPYALLTPTANPQIFTGQQRFQSTTTNLPISVASTTGAVTGSGGLYVATTAGQYNPIVKGNDLVLVGTGSAIDSASTKLTLTTHATSSVGIQMDIGNMTFDGGIIRQNSTFNCGYSYLATPLTVKGFYDIGYVWTIPYASFTGGAWATSTVVYNILTLAWDGTGNKKIGVWKVDVVIINTCTTAPSSSLCWNTVSNVSRTINDTCVGASDLFLFGATGCQIMRMSFTINVVNLTTTYYLNSLTGGGAGLASNTASQITFTRIA